MLISRLSLRNFGVYRGEQVLDLLPRSVNGQIKPVVLVGGHNGAGKTTLLEAIRLCLYGRLVLGTRITDSDYHKYLRDIIHKSKDTIIPIPYASVGLDFEYAHGGRTSSYSVQRAWEPKGANGVNEVLRVTRDGEPLIDVESQFWPEFVRSLIPPGVAQLFFFDGEKIKSLAEEESEASTLGDSIKALLGLDLVERLQVDLDSYTARTLRKSSSGADASRLGEIDEQETVAEVELTTAKERIALLEVQVNHLAEQIARVEHALADLGDGMRAQFGGLSARRAEIDAEEMVLTRSLKELCEDLLPFALCPTIAESLWTQLDRECTLQRWQASAEEVKKSIEVVRKRIVDGGVAIELQWDQRTRERVSQEFEASLKHHEEVPAELSSTGLLHGISEREARRYQDTLKKAVEQTPSQVRVAANELEALVEERRKLGKLGKQDSGESETTPLVRELSELNVDHAKQTLELKLLRDQEKRLLGVLTAIDRERQKIAASQNERMEMGHRIGLASSARKALGEYLQRLTTAKVSQLQSVALSCFQSLCRKTDLVQGLSIDPDTFAVQLMDRSGDVVPKSSLSAGEKQIYAISLLWALAKVSGRSLPMVVDTPLGRLDSVHRRHLLERYFPSASHQVVILSTDTEVDKSYLQVLEPNVSHSLHLIHHPTGWTEVTDGFFWEDGHGSAKARA